MADFKKLSDVEIVEAPIDTANVLIEENGVIKKAPKNEVGGIKVAAAEVGQTIVVKAVDENGNPTEWEAVDNVASWNDLEDKPFWEELEPLVSATITEYYDSLSGIIYQAKTPIELDVAKDKSYVVNVDGILYPCKGVHRNYMTSSHFYIGNGNFHLSGFPGNGEPFVICHCWDDVDGWYYTTCFSDNKPHTITVYKSIVKPLDTKYLPEALQIGEEVENTYIQEETTVTLDVNGRCDFEISNFPMEGTTYVIKWDGVEYEGTAFNNSDADTVVNIEINGEWLEFYNGYAIYGTPSMAGEHTLEILITNKTLKQLDEKFIKDATYPKLGPFMALCSDFASVTVKNATNDEYPYPLRTLVDGVMVNVWFRETNTAINPTLCVCDTGVYPIYGKNEEKVTGEVLTAGFHSFVFYNSKWYLIF